MNAPSRNEGKKSTVHIQLGIRHHQKQVLRGENSNSSTPKVHRLARINASGRSTKQQPTSKSVTKSGRSTERINAKENITNHDTSTGDVVRTPRLFENRVTDLNSSLKNAATCVNNGSLVEVIELSFHRPCV